MSNKNIVLEVGDKVISLRNPEGQRRYGIIKSKYLLNNEIRYTILFEDKQGVEISPDWRKQGIIDFFNIKKNNNLYVSNFEKHLNKVS